MIKIHTKDNIPKSKTYWFWKSYDNSKNITGKTFTNIPNIMLLFFQIQCISFLIIFSKNCYSLALNASIQDTASLNISICPSQNFNKFLEDFTDSEIAQENFIKYPLIKKILNFDIPPEGQVLVEHIEKFQISIPVVPLRNQLIEKSHKLQIDWIKLPLAQVTVCAGENDYIESFIFEKSDCWRLAQIIDKRFPPLNQETNFCESTANLCLMRGMKLEEEAISGKIKAEEELIDENYNPKELFDRALNAYICAARSGSAEGAFRAVRLGGSGESRFLPRDYVEHLLLQASVVIPDAAQALAEFYCDKSGVDSTAICHDIEKSEKMIIKAVKMGAQNAPNIMGAWLERGNLKRKDISRALGCYKLGSVKDCLAEENYERLLKAYKTMQLSQCIND